MALRLKNQRELENLVARNLTREQIRTPRAAQTREKDQTSWNPTEKAFQAWVLQLARTHNWAAYHTYNSQRSEPGFPDLVLAKDARLIFAELKTNTGKVSPRQEHWLRLLAMTSAEVYLWRPRQIDCITHILSPTFEQGEHNGIIKGNNRQGGA